MWPVEPVGDLVNVRAEVRWEVIRILVEPDHCCLGEFPGVANDAGVEEVVAGSRRTLLAASEIEYPRVRSPWMKRRTFRTREVGKL